MLQITAPGSFSAKFKNPPPIKQASKGEREYLRPSEVKALIKAAKSVGRNRVRDAAMILLMFRHGLRTAELVALKWSRVDLASGYLEVQRVKHGHHSVHPHQLRHSCGYYLATNGQDTRAIQDYLGHRNIQHTVRYTQLNPSRFESFWTD